MMKLLPIIIITGLISTLITVLTCDGAPRTNSKKEFYWNKAFGQAVLDWVVESGENSIAIEADWNAASWGLGAEVLLEEPINLKEVAEIQATVCTEQDSPTKVYIMVATPDDANLSFPSLLAYPVTSSPDKFTFPVDKMIKYKPDTTSGDFNDDDWRRVDRIKFILTKPATYEQEYDLIFISDIRIIYREKMHAETFREELDLNEAKEPSKDVENPDVEYRVDQTDKYKTEEINERKVDEIAANEVIGKQEISHSQSLDELIDYYPSDKSNEAKAIVDKNSIPKLIFDQVSIYENCVKDWKTMDDENKFFFDVNWKNNRSGFAMYFLVSDSIEISDEWYLAFKAQTLDRSKPLLEVTAYYGNEYLFTLHGLTLKNTLKTFYVPLKHKNANTARSNGRINQIKVTFRSKNSGLIRDDVVIIKDLQLVKKRQSSWF